MLWDQRSYKVQPNNRCNGKAPALCLVPWYWVNRQDLVQDKNGRGGRGHGAGSGYDLVKIIVIFPKSGPKHCFKKYLYIQGFQTLLQLLILLVGKLRHPVNKPEYLVKSVQGTEFSVNFSSCRESVEPWRWH